MIQSKPSEWYDFQAVKDLQEYTSSPLLYIWRNWGELPMLSLLSMTDLRECQDIWFLGQCIFLYKIQPFL